VVKDHTEAVKNHAAPGGKEAASVEPCLLGMAGGEDLDLVARAECWSLPRV